MKTTFDVEGKPVNSVSEGTSDVSALGLKPMNARLPVKNILLQFILPLRLIEQHIPISPFITHILLCS